MNQNLTLYIDLSCIGDEIILTVFFNDIQDANYAAENYSAVGNFEELLDRVIKSINLHNPHKVVLDCYCDFRDALLRCRHLLPSDLRLYQLRAL